MSVHFYVNSDYSLLESVCTVEALVTQAKKLGIKNLALTDHNTTAGHGELDYWCRLNQIKPLFGLEADVKFGEQIAQLVFIAHNNEGYWNLLKMASQQFPLSYRRLPDFKSGLVLLEGGQGGQITHLINKQQQKDAHSLHTWYKQHFGENYFLRIDLGGTPDLRTHFPEQQFVLSQNVRLLQQDSKNALQVLYQMKGLKVELPCFPMLSWEQLMNKFQDPAKIAASTLALAERCNVVLPQDLDLPHHPTEDDLDKLVWLGAQERFGELTSDVEERLNYELEIIHKQGFGDYFLIVADLVNFAKRVGIPVGPGRGSAAGSLVAYCLHITEVNPLEWGLLFERFLNAARRNRPDIDLDFCYERRQEVIAYAAKRFGPEHVAQIGTYGTFGKRSAAQEVERVLGEPNQVVAKQVQGLKRHRSTHAAGLIITQEPTWKLTSLYTDRDFPVTQLDMYSLERLGALKIDLLGLRTLTLLRKIEEAVQQVKPDFSLASLPLEDEKTFALLSKGKSAGVFQLESTLFQDLLRALKPASVQDLSALLALGRPGPLDIFPEYLRRRQNPSKVSYAHPDLIPILSETFGLVLYQEQVLLIGHKLGGLSLGEADLLRIALGKNDSNAINQWRTRFLAGAEKQGLSKNTAQQVFQMLVKFSGYAFNKAHSVSYAFLTWQSAYLKANYPREFYATLLNEGVSSQEQSIYLLECQSLGVKVLPPSVLYSDYETKAEGNALRLGLKTIRSLGNFAARQLLSRRQGPWTSFSHLRQQTELDEKSLETLVLAGACDGFGPRNLHLQSLGKPTRTELDLLQAERNLIGVYASKHPASVFLPLVRNLRGEQDLVVGEILEAKVSGAMLKGLIETPNGSQYFEATEKRDLQLLKPNSKVALFGRLTRGTMQVGWHLPLNPILLASPTEKELEILKHCLGNERGSKPVVLRLGAGAAYHLLPAEFWLEDGKRVSHCLEKAGITFVWFDPWKENLY